MYVIEDNIDFYKEIHGDNTTIHTESEDTCLISNTTLRSDFVSLNCGHKFNYDSIFYDICNHKNKFNTLEKYFLNTREIRCPYCRNVQNKLLPPHPSFPNIHGVNFFDEIIYLTQFNKRPHKWIQGQCGFTHKHYFNIAMDSSNNILELPPCNDVTVTFVNIFNTHFCNYHKNMCIHNYVQYKKQLSIVEKMKKKEEEKLLKIKMKQEAKQNIPYCSIIISKGKNKGNTCSFKCINNTSFCKRHQPSEN